MVTVGEYLQQATAQLQTAGIDTARLDCLVLLEDVTSMGRSSLLAHGEHILTSQQLAVLNKYIAQRERHAPLAYIRKKVEFYGRTFAVNGHVLVPRPETEAVIELLQALPLPTHPVIIDVGCGSGCIGITAALETPGAEVYLSDISSEALQVARKNARQLSAPVHVLERDLLHDTPSDINVVLINLPYVPTNYPVNQAATFEPSLALYAGTDGLDLYRQLWLQLGGRTNRPQHVICESLPAQHARMAELAATAGYQLKTTVGFVQYFLG